MSECPHCGSKLPVVRDAFCITCGEALDEPPEVPRTPVERAAFRAKVDGEVKTGLSLLRRILGLFGG
jgi:hypothetical protein